MKISNLIPAILVAISLNQASGQTPREVTFSLSQNLSSLDSYAEQTQSLIREVSTLFRVQVFKKNSLEKVICVNAGGMGAAVNAISFEFGFDSKNDIEKQIRKTIDDVRARISSIEDGFCKDGTMTYPQLVETLTDIEAHRHLLTRDFDSNSQK